MTNVRRARLWVLFCLAAWPLMAAAQSPPADTPTAGPPPAHIALIEGQVFIDREGRSDTAVENLPLLEGDRLRIENGRAEVVLPDGSLLHLDQATSVDVLAPDLWRLLQGRLRVTVQGVRDPDRAVRYQIDAAAGAVQTGGPGEFRVWANASSRGQEVELAVYRGHATLANDLGAQPVAAGERAFAREGFAPSVPQYFNSARFDPFDRWCAARRDAYTGAASAQYLPDELDVYASAFDRDGTWRYDNAYGYVWYPTVTAGWRPYSVGSWHHYPTYGSFWVGSGRWGWPTHHYGRWGFSVSFGWYWMPATVWAPAWVHWAVAPGYVSWCALGYNNYPVYGHWGVHGVYYGNGYDPWRGWVVMPRQHFGASMPVHRYAVDGHGLAPSSRGAFVAQRRSPAGYAVPRSYVSGTAVPRGSGGPTSQPGSPSPRMVAPAAPGAAGTGRPAMNGRAVPRGTPVSPAADPAGRARATITAPATGNDAVTRRPFGSAAPGAGVPRTESPAATPDATAFRNRRNARPAPQAGAGPGASASPESRYQGRSLPESVRSILPGSGNAVSPAPQNRQPSRATAPQPGRSAQPPRAPVYEAPRQGRPQAGSSAGTATGRDGAGGGVSRAPRATAPRATAPRATAPRATAPRAAAPRSAPPPRRESASRPGRPTGGSSGASAPRYNPGAGSAGPRGGGSTPPTRRRGGAPDA